MRRNAAHRGSRPRRRHRDRARAPAAGPEMRMTATPARPWPLDRAKIGRLLDAMRRSARIGPLCLCESRPTGLDRQAAPPRSHRSMSENRLGRETSPYLLQHKDNPVHWWAWGPEALAEAKRTGKPILLSVGYAACHWCHVMAHESFEDEATAARHERAVRQHQGRPRGAPRHRRHLHARAALAGRAGRLAADHVPRQRGAAVLGRHLLPARRRATAGPASPTCCARSSRIYARGARQGRATTPACWSTRSTRREAQRRRPAIDDAVLADLTRPHGQRRRPASTAASPARRSSRSGASSGCCGAAPSATATRPPSTPSTPRSPTSARAASTIISAAASRATRSTSAGSCRTSRRCSTTTRC